MCLDHEGIRKGNISPSWGQPNTRVQTVLSTRRAREGPGEGEGARGKRRGFSLGATAPHSQPAAISTEIFVQNLTSELSGWSQILD